MTQAPLPEGQTRSSVQPTEMSAWVGWIAFAAVMMVLLGGFHIIQGLVALLHHSFYLTGKNGLTLHVDYTVWGWVHIVGGVLILLAGFALLAGKTWGRIIAVILAIVSAFANIGFLGAYPIWSFFMIGIDILVLWALLVHGGEAAGVVGTSGASHVAAGHRRDDPCRGHRDWLDEQPGLVDAYGRVATDLRVSLTDRGNLRCSYCMPAVGLDWLPGEDLLSNDEVVRLV